jgi:hypothetical protein
MDYKQREELKEEGWNLLDKCIYPQSKCNIFMHHIIKSHYWRARKHIEIQKNSCTLLRKIRGRKYYKNYELDIDDYTPHWLFANKHLMDEETYKCCCKWYEPIESKYLPKGYTTYVFT